MCYNGRVMPFVGYLSIGLLILAVLTGFYDGEKNKYTSLGWLGVGGLAIIAICALLASRG